jgi:hypothetical protein
MLLVVHIVDPERYVLLGVPGMAGQGNTSTTSTNGHKGELRLSLVEISIGVTMKIR